MKLTITIKMNNEAFGDDPGTEVARILRKLSMTTEQERVFIGDSWRLIDINGNIVGKAEVTE